MTETAVRQTFINTLIEHFKSGRRPSEKALADLARELVSDGYDQTILDRAARDMIRTRFVKSFPSVAECLAACRVAQGQLRGDKARTGSGTCPPESRSCPSESLATPDTAPAPADAASGVRLPEKAA